MKDISLNGLQRSLQQHEATGWPLRATQLAARYALALVRDVFEGELSLRAMSLVYTTLLSLVPMLALSFSMLKAFGAHDALSGVLNNFLAPLGSGGAELAQHILEFVDKMKIGVLGSVGVVLLVYTSISLIRKVEASFNFAWEVHQGRGLSDGFGDYLSVLLVGPLLMFSALGLTASIKSNHVISSLMQIEPFGTILVLGFKLVPYVLMCGAFSFVYGFIPNTRVRVLPAVVAGICAGVAWQAASVAFATFVANAGNYNAVYSGFAIVIFLLIWLYVGWQVLLLGCRLAFYVQYPERLMPHAPPDYASREGELLALTASAQICRAFLDNQPPPTATVLARQLHASEPIIKSTLQPLITAGLLAQVVNGGGYLPAKDPEQLSVAALWLSSRGSEVTYREGDAAIAFLKHVEEVAVADAPSVKQWLQSSQSLKPPADSH